MLKRTLLWLLLLGGTSPAFAQVAYDNALQFNHAAIPVKTADEVFYFDVRPGMTSHQFTWTTTGFSAITVDVAFTYVSGGSYTACGSQSTSLGGTITCTNNGGVILGRVTIDVTGTGTFTSHYYGASSTAATSSGGGGGGGGGEVTNAGTFAVQVSSALPTGTNTIGKTGTTDTDDNSIAQAQSMQVVANLGYVNTGSEWVRQIGNGTQGTFVTILAGTASIGKLGANSGVDIGDVDVNSLIPGTGATNLGKAEDGTPANSDTGVVPLCIVQATLSATATDGKYGGVKCNANGVIYTVSGITDAIEGAALSNAPIPVACKYHLTRVTLDDGDAGYLDCGPNSELIVLPYASPANSLYGLITTAMTGTTRTAVTGMGAQGGSLRNYINMCTFSNMDDTTATEITLNDGDTTTVLFTVPAAINGGGAVVTFPTPLRTTANTALYAANITTGATTKVSCTGYKGL